MPKNTNSFRRIIILLVGVLAVLAAQNLIIFHNHYFNGYAFPWDFLGSYHAIPYYWIEAAKQGVDIAWIPFQGMGYPLYLNLQTGAYYPPFWLLVMFGKTYAIGVAVIMQGLHVWFGAIGAMVCARLMGMRWQEALLVGVVYQGFGAFYSNASHPDIVRTYALLPWLCAPVFSRWHGQSLLLWIGILSLPLWTYSLWTGGYPGGAVASLFVLGLTVSIRTLFDRNNRGNGMLVILALAAGCLVAGISLLPAFLDKSGVDRASQVGGLVYDYMMLGDVFALIYRIDNQYFGHDITMRSIYVGVPVLALLLLGIHNWRQWNIWVILAAAIAVAMASGALHKFIINVLPPLGYSRFTLADYRGFIGLGIILIAVQGGLSTQNDRSKGSYLWCVLLLIFVLLGNFFLQLNQPIAKREVGLLLLALLAVFVIIGLLRVKNNRLLPPLLIVVALLDWTRAQGNQGYFNSPNGITSIESIVGKLQDTRKTLTARLVESEGCRPARIDIAESNPNQIPSRGYYTGDYMMQDYSGPMKFLRQQQILASPALRDFASRPWVAVYRPETAEPDAGSFSDSSVAPVSCIRYGTTRIEYHVDLAQPQFVVENEVYWKGWSAAVLTPEGHPVKQLEAIDVQGFRGWRLPAGNYRLVATFEVPNLIWGRIATAMGLLLWVVLGWLLWRRAPWKVQAPT